MRVRAYVAAMALAALAACGPNVKDLQKGETGKVASVSDGDTLTLDNGLKVQLTGIIAPRRGYRDRPDEPEAKAARDTLEKLALGRPALLAYGGDRRLPPRKSEGESQVQGSAQSTSPGRAQPASQVALAQVFVKTEGGRWIWLQEAMLREGMARARTWKTNHARADKLYAAEQIARQAKKGIWADKAYAVHDAGKFAAQVAAAPPEDGRIEGFQEVEGVVRAVKTAKDRTYLDFGDDYTTDFSIEIEAKDLPAWTAADPAPESLKGKRVRVRGYVYDRGGPMIRIDHPQAIEVLTS